MVLLASADRSPDILPKPSETAYITTTICASAKAYLVVRKDIQVCEPPGLTEATTAQMSSLSNSDLQGHRICNRAHNDSNISAAQNAAVTLTSAPWSPSLIAVLVDMLSTGCATIDRKAWRQWVVDGVAGNSSRTVEGVHVAKSQERLSTLCDSTLRMLRDDCDHPADPTSAEWLLCMFQRVRKSLALAQRICRMHSWERGGWHVYSTHIA